MTDIFDKIEDFYRRIIDLPIPATPARLSPERKAAAVEHWKEETQEFLEAETIEDEIDAALDLAWLAIGRVIEMGANPRAHFDEIARANMSRVRGQSEKRPLSQGYDAVKPEGWVGPDHTSVIYNTVHERLTKHPRILVIGHARHGKDTVAEMLRDRYGLQFSSSSMFCAEHVMMPYFASQGVPYASIEECYADRANHRATWYDRIQDYNYDEPERLAREMIEAGNDMYVGMRSAREHCGARKLFDHVLWVDATGRGVPPEDSSSNTMDIAMATYIIDNSGDLTELERAVDVFARLIGLERVA